MHSMLSIQVQNAWLAMSPSPVLPDDGHSQYVSVKNLMVDTDSDLEELQAVSVLIPDLLRRILPVQSEKHGHGKTFASDNDALDASASELPLNLADEPTAAREEAAEELCDLVVSESYAQVAVHCMAFQILAKIAIHAVDSSQHRVAELCLSTLANITCHKKLAEQVNRVCTIHVVQQGLCVYNNCRSCHIFPGSCRQQHRQTSDRPLARCC